MSLVCKCKCGCGKWVGSELPGARCIGSSNAEVFKAIADLPDPPIPAKPEADGSDAVAPHPALAGLEAGGTP